jgi:WD40 repeat protein
MNEVPVANDLSLESLAAQVADEFLERLERGEQPSPEEYVARYPEHATVLRQVLTALRLVQMSGRGPTTEPAAPASEPPAGGRLGDFRILREIGRGGMGIVYEAEQESLGRRVALKVLPLHAASDPKLLARFRRESRAAAQLHHTNIVPIFDVGQHGDLCYYAMQFIPSQPLDEILQELQRLRAESPVSPRPESARGALASSAPLADSGRGETSSSSSLLAGQPHSAFCHNVARIALQAAEALAYAHERGVIHRDVKPSNLLLDGHGAVWVTDFGLAKATDSADLTHTGDVVGTVRYMAPERFRGECDARSDVYALGLTLYEMLTLRPAFAATDRLTLIDQIARLDPPRPRSLDSRIPRDLETIVMKAIDKDPGRRYPLADDLAADLRRFLADEPITARRIGPVERLVCWGRRNPVVAGLTAAVVLVTAGGFAATAAQTRAAQDERDTAQKQRDEVRALNEKLRATQAQLRNMLYVAQMNLARHALDEADVPRVLELLDQQRPKPGEPDLRGFEWHYLHRLCHSELLTFKGHTDEVTSVAFSPDGKRLASASRGELKVWDAQTGQELLALQGHGGGVRSVAFSPDGKRLASAGNEVKVWDAQTGQELFSLQGACWSVAFSPDGQRLASVSWDRTTQKGAVKVWDAQTGQTSQELLAYKGHTDAVYSVAFSPDGQRLAGSSWDSTVKVWDAQTGRELLTLKGHSDLGYSVAFSPDGKRLANAGYGGKEGGAVRVWDPQTGQELLILKGEHSNWVNSVVYSPDGKRLASAWDDGTVRVWDAQTGQVIRTIRGHTGKVTSVAFSPDGQRLASSSADKTIKVWDAQRNPEALTLNLNGEFFAFSPDFGRLASAASDNTVKVWDARTGQQTLTLKGHTAPVWSLAFSPDGKRLASGGGGHRLPGGTLGNSTRDRAELKVWDAQTGQELLSLPVSLGFVWGVAFSPDGKRLASATANPPQMSSPAVQVWDVQTGRELLALKVFGMSVAFSPDGKRLASGGRGDVKVLDAQTGQELLTLKDGGGSVAFSPDGKRLASGSKVWDAQTGQELLTLKGYTGRVNVVFSPDSKRLASAGGGGVWVWDAQTGQELLALKGVGGSAASSGGGSVAFSLDGHRLASGGTDGTVKIWDATPLPERP